jgi:hypothetical protein
MAGGFFRIFRFLKSARAIINQLRCSVWTVHFFAFQNSLITPAANFELKATVAISR